MTLSVDERIHHMIEIAWLPDEVDFGHVVVVPNVLLLYLNPVLLVFHHRLNCVVPVAYQNAVVELRGVRV